MIFDILIALLCGVFAGTFTGLTPGVHINLVAFLVLSFSPILLLYTSLYSLAVFIISMSITHTFLDAIPSIYLGAPDESQALNALPGHRYLIQGLGHYAVILTLIGSFFSLLLGITLFPVLLKLVDFLYPRTKPFIAIILLLLMFFMILRTKNWKLNFLIFMLSGTLGLIVLNIDNLNEPLLPLLSGLFGFSILINSYFQNTRIRKQSWFSEIYATKKEISKSVIASTIVGFFASFLPGLGSSQAAIIATQFFKKISQECFMILIGGINTANMLLSLVTLYAIQKARNGAVLVILKLVEVDFRLLIILLTSSLIAGSIAVLLSIKLSKLFSKIITKIDYKKTIISVMFFVTLLIFHFSGIIGIIVVITATSLGLFANHLGVGKNHLMGCLILPVILYFL